MAAALMAGGGCADGRWQMADGRWRMADGGWRMADGGWRMADGGKGWAGPSAKPPSAKPPSAIRRTHQERRMHALLVWLAVSNPNTSNLSNSRSARPAGAGISLD